MACTSLRNWRQRTAMVRSVNVFLVFRSDLPRLKLTGHNNRASGGAEHFTGIEVEAQILCIATRQPVGKKPLAKVRCRR